MDGGQDTGVPSEVRAFLDDCIDSIEQLEILMMLWRHDRSLRPRDLARRLVLKEAVVRDHLERLAGRGLLDVKLGAEDVMYRYDAAPVTLRDVVDRLARCYADAGPTGLTSNCRPRPAAAASLHLASRRNTAR
jgi:predicted DNA-binding transcriptional regulator